MTTYSYTIELTDYTFIALRNLLESECKRIKESDGIEPYDSISGEPKHTYAVILDILEKSVSTAVLNSTSSFVEGSDYSVSKYFKKPTLSDNPLWKILRDDVQDYFSRLGGSGRFIGYQYWYEPCFVLLCWLELTTNTDTFNKMKCEHNVSEKLWTQTDNLKSIVMEKLKNSIVLEDHVKEFQRTITNKLSQNNGHKDLGSWIDFVKDFNKIYPNT